jgi:site-specific DNA-methyltransferase (adenine-specific)
MNEQMTFIRDKVNLYLQDVLEGVRNLPNNSFDLAIADPPYGASTNATWKLENGHSLDGFGGAWKLASHDWDMFNGLDGFEFTLSWLNELKRLVKPTGSIWIHSTYHNSGIINVACQILGLEIINEVIWYKRNAFPNLSGRRLTASHETILWVHTGETKREYYFNYEGVKAATFKEDNLKEPGKQLRTVWDIPNNKKPPELEFGKHPTQKPLRLIERMLFISAVRGGGVLIPFLGSGTDIIAGLEYDMDCVGFEVDQEYFNLACQRISAYLETKETNLQMELPECKDLPKTLNLSLNGQGVKAK